MLAQPPHRLSDDEPLLPDLCSGSRVMAVVVIAELLAILLVLTPSGTQVDRWRDLGLISLFIQWTGLTSVGLLCLLKPWLRGLSHTRAAILSLLLLLAVVLLASEATHWIAESTGLTGALPDDWHAEFLLRNTVIGAIVGGLTLRYFFVQQQWKQATRAQMQARIEALQARIRPHFLFNTINTIANLIHTRSDRAEQAVEALAELFRASLSETRLIRLEAELALTQRYLEIEHLRLGERLAVLWVLDGVPQDALIPALTLQPLVENAIYHGIEPLPQGGQLRISATLEQGAIALEIRNPVGQVGSRCHGGHCMAQDSVRQRLAVCYGERGRLDVGRSADHYVACLTLPYIRTEQEVEKKR